MEERVLIVDDERGVLDGYERLLRKEFQLTVALGGAEGLLAIEKYGPFAVVISDMRMPEMTGADFLAEVKRRAPETVRMLLTGYTDMNAAIEAINRGNIFKFLTKPSTKEILVESIHQGINEYLAMQMARETVKDAEDFKNSISKWNTGDVCQWDNAQGPTGLPGPTQARAFLTPLLGTDPCCYVVMLRLTALRTIENRYGEEAASGYLNVATQFLMQSFEKEDRIFHWDRDILMAVVRRSVSPTAMRMEIARMTSASKEHMMDLKGRCIMISSPITFELQSVCQYKSFEKLFAAFDVIFMRKS